MRQFSAFQQPRVVGQNTITITNSGFNTSGASFSYTQTGEFLYVTCSSTTSAPTSVTYGGVALTQIGTAQFNTAMSRYYSVWYLVNPAQGSNTLAFSGGANQYFGLMSASGVDVTNPFSATTTGAGTAANPSLAVTTTMDNSYVILGALMQNTGSAGANTTLQQTVTGANSYIFRSTNVVSPAGSFTANTSMASGEYVFKAIALNSGVSTTKAYYPLNGNLAGSLKDSLIASYRLEDVSDSFGSYTLTNTGSVPFNAGKIGNGADFTPNDSLNNNSVLGATSYPRSFAGWAKFDTITGDDRTIFSLSDGSVHYYILKVRDSDDHIVFRSNNTTQAGDVDTGITASTGTWYHWAVVQNSATSVTIYINNVETNTAASTFTCTVSQFYLGYLGRSSVWWMDGIIDEVGIWNRALTADEVSRLYNAGNGQQLETRALDYSGNANHGTETAITYTQGKFGQGARFNGTSSIISRASNLNITGTSITLSAWFKVTTQPASGEFQLVVRQSENTNKTDNFIRYENNGGTYSLNFNRGKNGVGDQGYVLTGQLQTDKWYNAIYTYDGSTVKGYLGGLFVGSASASGNGSGANPDYVTIGAWYNSVLTYFYPFKGIIDEVIIENRAWTAKEIETYYRKSVLNYKKQGFFAQILSYILSVSRATFSVTPKAVAFNQTMIANKSTYSIVMKAVNLITQGWAGITRNLATWTGETKNTSTWTDETKNNSTWTDIPKS